MKKILLIAYHYHPDLSVGAQRTVKYVKYLPQFGWEPSVLTVDPQYYAQKDETPLGFECPVYRTSRWPLPDDIYRKLKGLLASKASAAAQTRTPSGNAASDLKSSQSLPTWKKFLNTLSMTPDVSSGWYFPAVLKARQLIRRERFDAIYTSGPPHTCHLVGLTAHRLTSVPWVADFRDPWVYPKKRDESVLEISKKFDRKFEASLARRASLVITTTDEWRDHLKELYHPLLDDKCHCIINGFDEDDFPSEPDASSHDESAPITFLYAGNLYSGRDPSTMLTAAGELLAEGALNKGDLAFSFYGNTDIDRGKIDRIVSDYGLDTMVSFNPPVARENYLRLLQKADVLILIQADQAKVHLPAKAFEYLGTGNEILTLTSEGSTRNFMSKFPQVSLARLEDKGELKAAIVSLVARVKDRGARSDNCGQLKAITKKHLTEQFAALLDGIV